MSSRIHPPRFCPDTGFPLSPFSTKTVQPSVNTQVCIMGPLGSVVVSSWLHPVEVVAGVGEAAGVGPPLPAAHSGNFVRPFSETSFSSTCPARRARPSHYMHCPRSRRTLPHLEPCGCEASGSLPCQPPPSPPRCLPGWAPQADAPFPSPLLPRSRHQLFSMKTVDWLAFVQGLGLEPRWI